MQEIVTVLINHIVEETSHIYPRFDWLVGAYPSFTTPRKFLIMCVRLLVTKQDQLLLLEERIFRRWTFNSISENGTNSLDKGESPDVKNNSTFNYSYSTTQYSLPNNLDSFPYPALLTYLNICPSFLDLARWPENYNLIILSEYLRSISMTFPFTCLIV